MRIEVDLGEKWSRVAYYYSTRPEVMRALLESVSDGLAGFDFFSLTCGELCYLIDNRIPPEWESKYKDINVKNFCRLTNSVRDGLKGFEAYLEKTTPPMTAEQRRMSAGQMEVTAEEMILLQNKDFYNLHSLEEAQKLSVYEFMIARKANYNRCIEDYNRLMAAKTN